MAKDDIPLHPEKGVNPHMTVCGVCGKDTDEIILVGANSCVLECAACTKQTLGKKRAKKCPACGAFALKFVRELEDMERLPSLCEECHNKNEEAKRAVEEGGIYWRCTDCQAEGAIKAESQLAQDVRKQMNIEPPEPCGIEFTHEHCPACSDAPTEEDT